MDHAFCPGAKLLRQPAPELFPCPSCGEEVEIWTDEFRAACPKCRRSVYRDGALSCLDWCKKGQECVGEAVYESYMNNKIIGVKHRLLEELSRHFEGERRHIEHAERVLHYAERLLQEEEADWHIVVPAAILHDVGIKAAEQKYGSHAADLQEKEGPPVARKILLKLGLRMEDIEQICEIIAHHHSPGVVNTRNFQVLYDADCLVNFQTAGQRRGAIGQTLLTETGRKLALDAPI